MGSCLMADSEGAAVVTKVIRHVLSTCAKRMAVRNLDDLERKLGSRPDQHGRSKWAGSVCLRVFTRLLQEVRVCLSVSLRSTGSPPVMSIP